MTDVNEVKKEIQDAIAPYKYKVMLGAMAVACIIFCFIAFTMGKYHPDPSIVQMQVDQQLSDAKDKYEKDMAAKNKEIANISKLLEDSYKKNTQHYENIAKIKDKYKKIKPVKTKAEAQKIMKEYGYETY